MLTVKVISSDGNESVHEAVDIEMISHTDDGVVHIVYYRKPGDHKLTWVHDADIYIYNEKGVLISGWAVRPFGFNKEHKYYGTIGGSGAQPSPHNSF